eukprot:CAMPEP_0182796968 /NCGR_PEP_ID=MMETSP0006_2-20121128/559_1 /TAXON_ID=97485 /ORGANISM="Prymnesium parvum, Strain Texoma1" /LENGTH=124 /DNA_ID=CAMNT_0024921973 /DNA_START=509 /DNA_END=885 /DNA_ORIENTATION=-
MTATVRAIVERGNPSKLVSATELASGTSLSPSSRPMLNDVEAAGPSIPQSGKLGELHQGEKREKYQPLQWYGSARLRQSGDEGNQDECNYSHSDGREQHSKLGGELGASIPERKADGQRYEGGE